MCAPNGTLAAVGVDALLDLTAGARSSSKPARSARHFVADQLPNHGYEALGSRHRPSIAKPPGSNKGNGPGLRARPSDPFSPSPVYPHTPGDVAGGIRREQHRKDYGH